MDSEGDDYYDSDTPASDYNYNSDEADDQINEAEKPSDQHELKYTVLNEADIHQRQLDDIDTVATSFSVGKEAASILLINYCWDLDTFNDAWFSDEQQVLKTVGLLPDDPVVNEPGTKRVRCTICFEKRRVDKFTSTSCGHLFCILCWKRYVETSIHDGPGCLTLRCPQPKCRTAVGPDLIDRFVSEPDKERYDKFLIRSYVDQGNRRKKIKWCPASGCECAVEFRADGSEVDTGGGYDVLCRCLNQFCWNCSEDAHRPVDCETVAKWMTKGKSEAENTAWILAYTKPCPKCKRPIEKNKGCMHMICGSGCKFQFCWLCLEQWSKHDDYYKCNTFEKAKKEGTYNKEEETRKMAKKSNARYTHYYERWANNDKSRKKAIEDLNKMESENLDKIISNSSKKDLDLKFILEAWVQIVECRRVLKWAYAYGYYIAEKEQAKKTLFEYLQGVAEACLERLHLCAETELEGYLTSDKIISLDEFNEFRLKLIGLTKSTHTYFENLVKGLQDGLSEAGSSN